MLDQNGSTPSEYQPAISLTPCWYGSIPAAMRRPTATYENMSRLKTGMQISSGRAQMTAVLITRRSEASSSRMLGLKRIQAMRSRKPPTMSSIVQRRVRSGELRKNAMGNHSRIPRPSPIQPAPNDPMRMNSDPMKPRTVGLTVTGNRRGSCSAAGRCVWFDMFVCQSGKGTSWMLDSADLIAFGRASTSDWCVQAVGCDLGPDARQERPRTSRCPGPCSVDQLPRQLLAIAGR
ncbi:hypothetical protein PSCLAVI8L_90149 [Pseudoclavibacter sp. 8L]|nr:hypothetical protein PSCLAVI8L_90149 [Pseudoclavibacter sp. 8L]